MTSFRSSTVQQRFNFTGDRVSRTPRRHTISARNTSNASTISKANTLHFFKCGGTAANAEQYAFADAKTCHKPIPKGRAKPIDRFDIFSYGNRCPARFSFKEIVTELEHGRSISFKNISGLNQVFRLKLKNKRWRCYN
jgi:hypothetical protein